MILTENGSGRRILNFPAVHPCINIASSTLLSSLINLSDKISNFQHKFFSSNKRNARKAIRLIGLLQPFLHEILENHSNLPAPVTLCFSELHVIFQKLFFLMEDLTCEGGRLFMLMESGRVATMFRVLFRSVASALDVLDFDSVEVGLEGKEEVLLVMKQVREGRFKFEVDDEEVVTCVKKVLNLFEKRVAPKKIDLKRVVDYIGVCEWNEINKEVKFLDGEIGFEWLNEEKEKVGFLSSLMGFMCYCRCVMIEIVDCEEGKSGKKFDARRESEMILSCLNSDDFRCPISLELMSDPVTIETGHTYDRSSILKWFRSGNSTCPKTGKSLGSIELVPNLVLRRLIQQYCNVNGIPFADSSRRSRDITRTVEPGSVAAEGAMTLLAGFLCRSLDNGNVEQKNHAAFEVRVLTKTSIFSRSCFVESGLVPLLLLLLASSDSSAQENAIAALLNLSKYIKSRSEMVENWGLEMIVGVLNKGINIEAKQHAAAVLFYLASNPEHANLIGEEPEAIPSLISLIKDDNKRSVKNGLVAIFGLLKNHENHKRILAAQAIPLLVNILKASEKEDLVTDSLAILATLAEKSDGTSEILRFGALHVAVEVMSSSSTTSRLGKEHCVSLLLSLSINGGENVIAHLVKSSSLMESLYSQLSEGTSRASKKASSLIRVLHDFYERRSSNYRTSVIPRERFIHVW
ncbi:putative aminoacyltransferase, E1 ubiquitin-activating enzyme [Medicago truncatula]|uniref:RING-type E3 ubiquitin transferase n=1 Tax=Medicago truncatula TaxID=3880 RepID=G7K1E9_MEDTR|nr:U-box domain-containing protein 19 [Medicago truncatula]AES96202.1 armadillo/beta-catenin repeat protein [Medicago truncatula]RHN55067.1 putative aminoacyltransferase, E1 ubiquitin-activating enzyme [Medicago truncatula]